MASLKTNVNQAISDFNSIEAALEECGVDVPYDTNTSEYGNLIRKAVAMGGGLSEDEVRKIVEEYLINIATKDEVAAKANDVLFPEYYVVGNDCGAFSAGDSLQNLTLRAIITKILNAKEELPPMSIIDFIMLNEIPMLSGSEDGVNATTYAYSVFTSAEAKKAPTSSGFYQIIDGGDVSESGYQLITESTGRSSYAIALVEGATLVDVLMWDEPTSTWVDYLPVFTQTGTTTVDGYTYAIYTSADSSSGETLRFIIE